MSWDCEVGRRGAEGCALAGRTLQAKKDKAPGTLRFTQNLKEKRKSNGELSSKLWL